MFSRQTKPSGRPSTGVALTDQAGGSARKSGAPKVASVIAGDITIDGNVTGDGELHLDGVVRGDVRASRLSIGETGQVEGAVQAEVLEARGRIVGSITAKQVRLYATAHVDGDITHEQLVMEAGAFFQGRSLKFQRPASPPPIELVDLTEPELSKA